MSRQHDRLPVKPGLFQAKASDRFRLSGKFRSPIVAIAGEQPYIAILHAAQEPIPVEFDFMEPVIIRGHPVDQRGQLRRNPIRLTRFDGAGQSRKIRLGEARGFHRRRTFDLLRRDLRAHDA